MKRTITIQIICQYKSEAVIELVTPALSNVRWMVDECDVRDLPDNLREISLIKWLS